MNPENGKKTYESIEIPKNLNETVMQTIASKNKEELKMKYESNENKKASEAKKSYRPVWRGCVAGGSSRSGRRHHRAERKPVFAENMSKVPVVGQLAQVLTFRSFEGTEGDVELNVNVPVVKGPDGKELPAKVNARIQQLTADYEAQAEKEMAEYKESFFQTGGTKEEWADRTMDLYIDYDVKYLSNDVLSLGVTTAKSWVSADEEHTYYNIDLKNDKELTLARRAWQMIMLPSAIRASYLRLKNAWRQMQTLSSSAMVTAQMKPIPLGSLKPLTQIPPSI